MIYLYKFEEIKIKKEAYILLRSIKSQTSYMMQRWPFILTWYVVFGITIINFCKNVMTTQRQIFISEMFDITKTITLSDWSEMGYFFMIYYPILVVFPTSYIMLHDKDSGIQTYLIGRLGRKNYYFGKLISVFISTFIIFTLPFIMEFLLELVCFHLSSNGDPSNITYDQALRKIEYYFLHDLYLQNKIVYVVVIITIFGIVSGIFAVFNVALSTLSFMKYKIFTFVPVYLLLYLLALCEKNKIFRFTTNYMFVLRAFEESPNKNYFCYGAFLLCLIIISILLMVRKCKKGELK